MASIAAGYLVGRLVQPFHDCMLEILIGVATLVVVALGAGIALVVLRAKSNDARSTGRWPFSLRRPLTEPEQVLYFRLCQANCAAPGPRLIQIPVAA